MALVCITLNVSHRSLNVKQTLIFWHKKSLNLEHTPLHVEGWSAGSVPPAGRRAPLRSGPGRSTELWQLLGKCISNISAGRRHRQSLDTICKGSFKKPHSRDHTTWQFHRIVMQKMFCFLVAWTQFTESFLLIYKVIMCVHINCARTFLKHLEGLLSILYWYTLYMLWCCWGYVYTFYFMYFWG